MNLRAHLAAGQVIPALPLALTRQRRWDEISQRALVRYYADAGAGGLAVAVHSTEFSIRERKIGLFEPVLDLAATTMRAWRKERDIVLIAGICGRTKQAMAEATLARRHGYHAGLVNLTACGDAPERALVAHCRAVARVIPIVGFYLQPAVGGRRLSPAFWRALAEEPELVAIKIAPFNRSETVAVVRSVMETGREDVAFYTGNDDNIIADLLTPFEFAGRRRWIAGGLLGQWGVWTRQAVRMLGALKQARRRGAVTARWATRNAQLTDANAAIFDAAHGFAGCIPGIHEVLRRQGLLTSTACLDRAARLSAGQAAEISRVTAAYPWLVDDDFVRARLDRWRKA